MKRSSVNRTVVRRLSAAVVAPVLTVGMLAAAPAAQAVTNAPETAASTWLAAQPDATTHLFESHYLDQDGKTQAFTDYGLNLDIYSALAKFGNPTAEQVYAATVAHANDYTDSFGTRFAGAVAKLAVAVQTHGDNPASVGGRNLIADLSALVATSGASEGRATDNPAGEFESSNTITQAFTVRALTTASSDLGAKTVAYLLKQQCADGSFRLLMADTQCTTGTASVDGTAFAIQALETAKSKGDTTVTDDIDEAAAWLVKTQSSDGSFSDGGTPNTNSTGLAAAALKSTDHPGPAGSAAGWVVARQLTSGADLGSIALNDTDLAGAKKSGILTVDRDKFVRASVQAALGLDAVLPSANLTVTRSPSFVADRSKLTVTATGLTAGEKVSFAMPDAKTVRATASASGKAVGTITTPSTSGRRTVTVRGANANRGGTVLGTVLGARTLHPKLKYSTVKHGHSQRISITGLAPNEPVKVGYHGKAILTSKANSAGSFSYYFKVGSSKGKQSVSLVGAFSDRRGLLSFKVS
jgi:hypothetical protein